MKEAGPSCNRFVNKELRICSWLGDHAESRSERRFLPRSRDQPTPCRRGGSVLDRKSTRLNSSHSQISYAVFCLKKKTIPAPVLVRHHHHTLGLQLAATGRHRA